MTRAARWRFALCKRHRGSVADSSNRDAGPQPRTDLGFARRPRSLPRARGASDAAAPPPRKGQPSAAARAAAGFPRAGARRCPMEHPRPAPTGAPQGTESKPTAPRRTLVERLRVPVLLPDSKLRNYWDALMFVVIFYNCNLTPVSITAPPSSNIFRRLRRVDFAIDLLFLVDTLLGFYATVTPAIVKFARHKARQEEMAAQGGAMLATLSADKLGELLSADQLVIRCACP